MASRTSVQDFSIANRVYAGAQVTAYTIDANGDKTSTKATLYDAVSGSDTLDNPQTLDSDGRFTVPVYIEEPIILSITGARDIDAHDSGVVGLNLQSQAVSDAEAARDAALSYLYLAESALTQAKAAKTAAEAAVAGVGLPSLSGGDAGKMLEVNGSEDGYDLAATITPTGIQVGDGSVSAPSYSFTGGSDSDTGIYRPGADIIATAVGGVQGMKQTESGSTVTTEFPSGPTVARPEIVTEKTDSFTFALAEADRMTPVNKASAINATVPPNSSVAFPVGTILSINQTGAGQVTWVAGSGVTLNVESTLTLLSKGQHAITFAQKTATNTWTVGGNLEAA